MSRAPSPTSSSHERSCKCHGITARARRFARPELDIQHARTAQASASAVEFLSSFLMTWNPPDDAHPAVLALVVPVTAKHRDSSVRPRTRRTTHTHTHIRSGITPRPVQSQTSPTRAPVQSRSCAAPVQSRHRFNPGTPPVTLSTSRPLNPDESSRTPFNGSPCTIHHHLVQIPVQNKGTHRDTNPHPRPHTTPARSS